METLRIFQALLAVLFILPCGCTEQRQARLIQSAEQKIQDGKHQEGANQLKKAIGLNPESRTAVRAIYKLGFTLETYLKDAEGALFNYDEFIRLSQDPMSVYEVQKRKANIYFDQVSDPEKAILAYKQLMGVNRESLELDLFQYRIATCFFIQNKFDQARAAYQEVLERFPKSQFAAKSRFGIGNSYYMEGKYDIALDALKEVMRHHPQTEQAAEAQFLMGQTLELQEKHESALLLYESLQGRYSSTEILNIRMAEVRKRIHKK